MCCVMKRTTLLCYTRKSLQRAHGGLPEHPGPLPGGLDPLHVGGHL